MVAEEDSFVRRHWEGYKEFWGERFSFLENYSRFIKRDKPLPSWSEADVEEFIASDPLHGPTASWAYGNAALCLCLSAIGLTFFSRASEFWRKWSSIVIGPSVLICLFSKIFRRAKVIWRKRTHFIIEYLQYC